MLASSFSPHGPLQRALTFAACVVAGVILLATRHAQRRGWNRLTSKIFGFPLGDFQAGWYNAVRWTFPGLFLLAIGLAGFGGLVVTGR